jgi:NAD(P)-dependent dehydrogenase (short-subunit alcohol dehydrogenase family)
MVDLDGKLIVVTGAGRGLGLAMARHAGESGARIVIAEREPDRAERAAAALRAAQIEATAVIVDVADEGAVAELAARVAEFGELWGLVNNAGLADAVGGKTFDRLSVEDWDRIMAVNARGPWLVSKHLLPGLKAGGAGRIVNLASDAALYGSPRLSHYIASKGAVIALTRAMARELGDDGITVNAVAPGLVESESSVDIPAARHQLYADGRAITRAQTPDDVSGMVTFLLSDEARYITGQTIVVDGGFVMP